jgi:carboxyl-terminal processing protease
MKRHGKIFVMCVFLLAACAPPQPSSPAVPTTTPAPSAAATLAPTISPQAAAYLEAALEIMETNSLNRLETNWDETRALAAQLARDAQTPADIHAVITYLLPTVGGRHSFFMTPEEASKLEQGTLAAVSPPSAKLLLNRLGFVAIQSVQTLNAEQETEYATLAQQLIREVDAQSPCGWIVDLRNNSGGNMWPMLTGLGPILGEGVAGKFIEPDGHEQEWSYRGGQSFIDDEVVTGVAGEAYKLQAEFPPVAVLIGFNTSSSGEAIAISFRGRPHTRSFGVFTAGFSTANASFSLSDGALMVLTTSVMADRAGQTFGSSIDPDERVDGNGQFAVIEDVTIPQAAIDWLLAEPACAAQG